MTATELVTAIGLTLLMLCFLIAFTGKHPLWKRWVMVGLYALIIPVFYLNLSNLLGQPLPVQLLKWMPWVSVSFEGDASLGLGVYGYRLIDEKEIDLLVQFKSEFTPRWISLPWDNNMANQIQDVIFKIRITDPESPLFYMNIPPNLIGSPLRITSHDSSNIISDRRPIFYPLPNIGPSIKTPPEGTSLDQETPPPPTNPVINTELTLPPAVAAPIPLRNPRPATGPSNVCHPSSSC